MARNDSSHVQAMLNRLSRLEAAEGWSGDLNPAQVSALRYLGQANRFSRSPSHLAAYLEATRGTVSQTLKVLERKGYVVERRSSSDKRRVSYDVLTKGRAVLSERGPFSAALAELSAETATGLEGGLRRLLQTLLAKQNSKPFGFCRDCQFHEKRGKGGFCTLLSAKLQPEEVDMICHEQKEREPHRDARS